MKNFTKIALTALAALATIAPTAQAKTTIDGITFYEPSDFRGAYAQVAQKLDEMQIPIVDGRETNLCESDTPGAQVMGWYTGDQNFMVLCYGSQADINETLTHEAVHAMQDCRTGLNNSDLGELGGIRAKVLDAALSNDKKALINKYYEVADHQLEKEAFFYESNPAATLELLNDACGAQQSFSF